MTITNDERREVAKELRYTASHSLNGYSFQRAVEGIAFGTLGDRPWRETLTRLADLIEPETQVCEACPQMDDPDSFIFHLLQAACYERTCRNLGGEEGTNFEYYDFGCSACGYCCDLPKPNYCPNCSARVVD